MFLLNYIKYKKLAYWDIICNCHNRNFLEDKLVKKFKNKLTFLTIVDIDYFKSINDSLGHINGDKILHTLIETISVNDNITYICRYGGDEFIVLHNKAINFGYYNELFKSLTGATFSYGTVYKDTFDTFSDALMDADKRLYIKKGDK